MIQVGITKKMKDKYGLDYEVIPELSEASLFTWHANIFKFNRKTGIIFINNLTRYSVLVFDVKKSDMKNLLEVFKWQLKRMINSHYYKLEVIENYLDQINGMKFTKTSSRSILGHINVNTDYLLRGLYDYEFIGKFEIDHENILNEKKVVYF